MPLTIPQIEIITTAANQRIVNVFEGVGFALAGQHMVSEGQVREVLNAFFGLTEDQQEEFRKSFKK